MKGSFMQFRPKRIRFPRPGWNFHTIAPTTLLLLWLPFYLTGGIQGPLNTWYGVFGLSQEGLFEKKQIWTLLTHPFLHGNFTHWFTNAFFLYYFGGRIHDTFGEQEVWRTAAWSTIAGGLLHLLCQGSMPLVGASGIGMGFFIALTTISPDSKMFPLPIRAHNLRNGFLLATSILLLMLPTLGIPIFGHLGEIIAKRGGENLFRIGHACHLGGALAGILAMQKYYRKPITLAQLKRERAAREENGDQAA